MKGLLITLAMPPVGFLCLTILGLAVARWRRRCSRALACLGLAGLTLLALPIFSDVLLAGLERDLPLRPPADAMPQAIVILGGDLNRTADPPFVLPGFLSLDRMRAGVALYRKTGLPILVTGGIVHPHHQAVATIMADSLRDDFQVPVAWVEPRSQDTWENAAFSADILKQQGIRSVYVVTQGWHERRAMLAFRHAGLIATAAPTSLEAPIDPIVWDFLPRASAWGWSYYALHEWIGCAWYAIR